MNREGCVSTPIIPYVPTEFGGRLRSDMSTILRHRQAAAPEPERPFAIWVRNDEPIRTPAGARQ